MFDPDAFTGETEATEKPRLPSHKQKLRNK